MFLTVPKFCGHSILPPTNKKTKQYFVFYFVFPETLVPNNSLIFSYLFSCEINFNSINTCGHIHTRAPARLLVLNQSKFLLYNFIEPVEFSRQVLCFGSLGSFWSCHENFRDRFVVLLLLNQNVSKLVSHISTTP